MAVHRSRCSAQRVWRAMCLGPPGETSMWVCAQGSVSDAVPVELKAPSAPSRAPAMADAPGEASSGAPANHDWRGAAEVRGHDSHAAPPNSGRPSAQSRPGAATPCTASGTSPASSAQFAVTLAAYLHAASGPSGVAEPALPSEVQATRAGESAGTQGSEEAAEDNSGTRTTGFVSRSEFDDFPAGASFAGGDRAVAASMAAEGNASEAQDSCARQPCGTTAEATEPTDVQAGWMGVTPAPQGPTAEAPEIAEACSAPAEAPAQAQRNIPKAAQDGGAALRACGPGDGSAGAPGMASPESGILPAWTAAPQAVEGMQAGERLSRGADAQLGREAAPAAAHSAEGNAHAVLRIDESSKDAPPLPPIPGPRAEAIRFADAGTNPSSAPVSSEAVISPGAAHDSSSREAASTAPGRLSGAEREANGQSESPRDRPEPNVEMRGSTAPDPTVRSAAPGVEVGGGSSQAGQTPEHSNAGREDLHGAEDSASRPRGTERTEETSSTTGQERVNPSSKLVGDAAKGTSCSAPPATNTIAQNSSTAIPAPTAGPPARAYPASEGGPPGGSVRTGGAEGESWKSGELSAQPGSSELHVTFQTDGLGPVELRASLRQNILAASIAVTRGDVQAALSGDLPAVHQAMAQHNLRLESLKVTHGAGGNHPELSAGSHSPRGNRDRPSASARGQAARNFVEGEAVRSAGSSPELCAAGSRRGRVSIHV